MRSESFGPEKAHNENDHVLWLKNKMQFELVKRQFGDDAEEYLAGWIAANSTKFREAFSKHIAGDPQFLERYEKEPEAVLAELETEMKLDKAA